MSQSPPEVPIEPRRKSLRDVVSIVWLVPILALLVALGIGIQTYADRGPLIEISFENASGVTAGQTELRYRDVAVGVVEEVTFTESLEQVLVKVRLDKTVRQFVDSNAEFWIVRPQVSTRGISGLDTVLSGVYIAGSWDDQPDGLTTEFRGASDAPITQFDRDGVRIQLRSVDDSGLTENTPIVYKGIEVGRVGSAQIAQDGSSVVADAVIFQPHDRLISSATRFWDTSGFSLKLGAAGAEIDFSSVASLVSGGITFDTIVSGGDALQPDDTFDVYADEAGARSSVFAGPEGETLSLSVLFEDNISGLKPDAAVELNGLKIGTVSNLNGLVDPERFGDQNVRLLATLVIRPTRLGLPDEVTPDSALEFFSEQVRDGLRARLASASLLTGGLKVELVPVDNIPVEEMDLDFDPYPRIPSTENQIADVSATAEGVFQRINNLPIEELLDSAITLIDSTNAVVNNDDLRAAPEELRALLSEARELVGSDSAQSLPDNLNATIAEIDALIAEINEQGTVERLLSAVDAAAKAGEGVSTAVEGVPALIEDLQAVAGRAKELPLTELAEELTTLVKTADEVIGTEDAKALPGALNTALAEVEATLAELREGGVVDNVNATLGSAREAADSVSAASDRLPEIVDRLAAVLNQASATLSDYDGDSDLNRGARAALADIRKAAEAVASLARAIERRPNSLVTGR